jgi:catechol 2,3-dioxygenase-like lactoylglutathione lyase family enzyme
MKIEHFALNVEDPQAMAQWYVANLGMSVVRGDNEPPYVTFLAAAGGGSMIELYANPQGEFLDYGRFQALTFHIAFAVADITQERDRLLQAGATADGEISTTARGDKLAMLRDPWGHAIQLVQRTSP